MASQVTINGRYRLNERPLARGGMGEIWPAHDVHLDRTVAVKFLRFPDGEPDADLLKRFQREARLAARLDHPGVPAIHDLGISGGQPYIVMQLIDGINVADLIAEHDQLPLPWVAAIAAQVSSVLIAAHQSHLIHRDIKPLNLMLDQDGAVKVLDFGLASALAGSETSRITHTGQSVGTPAYMAPEQVLGEPASPGTDIYGLGSTLFELLSGDPPFSDATSYAIMNRHVNDHPPRARDLRPEIPVELDELLAAMLEKRPEDRPSSITVYEALAPFAENIPPLPGLHARADSPRRAYAAIVSHLPVTQGADPVQAESPGALSHADLDHARRDALELLRMSRPASAARILGVVTDRAIRTFGATDDNVLDLCTLHGRALFDAREYRHAARQYRALAQSFADLYGDDDERVLTCRTQAAMAHVMLGERERARTQLEAILSDRLRINGPEDPAVQQLQDQLDLLRGPSWGDLVP